MTWPVQTDQPIDAARKLIACGCMVVPVDHRHKNPRRGWRRMRLAADDLPQHFPVGEPANVGVVLGRFSSGLVDLHLDAREAPGIAPLLLPPTLRFGRVGKPRSHWLFYSDGFKLESFRDPVEKTVLVELRGDNQITIFPPSHHEETGEQIIFDGDAEPATIAPAELRNAAAEIAAASLLRRRWALVPRDALIGALGNAGWPPARVLALLTAVAGDASSDEVQAILDNPRRRGWSDVAAALGKPTTRALVEWLRASPVTASTSDDDAPPPGALPLRELMVGSQVECAQRLLAELQTGEDPIVFVNTEFRRYTPKTGAWEPITEDTAHRMVQDYDDLPIRGRDRRLTVSAGFCGGTIECAQRRTSNPNFFTEAPTGFAFRDYFVTVDKTGLLPNKHSPDNRAIVALPFNFDASAICPRWLEFLGQVFEGDPDMANKIQFLREFAGSAMLGIGPHYCTAAVLLGGGANGKSITLDVLTALVPTAAVRSIPPQAWEAEYSRARIDGGLLNVVNEMPESEVMSSESVKGIIDGNLTSARLPFGRPFEFRPRCAHIFACNTLPSARDQSDGFWRRWRVVTFNRQFTGAAQAPKEVLRARLLAELPGITTWALQGAAEAIRRGNLVEHSGESVAELGDWRESSDQIRQFVAQCLEPAPESWVGSADLYRAYRDWTGRTGHHPLSLTAFGRRLVLLLPKRRVESGRQYETRLLISAQWKFY